MHNLYNIINSGRQQSRTTGGVGKEGGIHYEVLLGPVAAFCCCYFASIYKCRHRWLLSC